MRATQTEMNNDHFFARNSDGGAVKLWYPDMKLKKAFKLDSGNNVDVVKAASRAKVIIIEVYMVYFSYLSFT